MRLYACVDKIASARSAVSFRSGTKKKRIHNRESPVFQLGVAKYRAIVIPVTNLELSLSDKTELAAASFL
jgi:hypothetical protein